MKRLLLSAVLLSSIGAYAQVGVNTTDPKASFEVAYDAAQGDKVQAIGLPQVSNTQKANFKAEDLQAGQIIWNTTKQCIEVYKGQTDGKHQWICLTGTESTSEGGVTPPNPDGQPQTGEGTVSGGGATLASIKEYVVAFNYEGVTIDGTITTEGVKVKIPYTGGSGAYNATTVTSTSMADAAVNEKPMPFTLEVEGGTYNSSNPYMTAVIKPNSTYEAKKLTEPGDEKEIVSFKLKAKGQSEPATITLKSIAGIPDKNFADADHKFVYLPVKVEGTVDGKPYSETWLNNNLGADYANTTKKIEGRFDPTRQATSPTDYNAYGSLFQFGRDGDGHELVNWSGPKKGTRAKYVTWKSDSQLSYSPDSDPCPAGYRTPNKEELDKLRKVLGGNNIWNNEKLNLPVAGFQNTRPSSYFSETGKTGYYWTRTNYKYEYSYLLYFTQTDARVGHDRRETGLNVRCVKK